MKRLQRAIAFLLATAVAVGAAGCQKASEDDEIQLSAGQELWIGQIESISGNEMVLAFATEEEISLSGGQRGQRQDSSGNNLQDGAGRQEAKNGAASTESSAGEEAKQSEASSSGAQGQMPDMGSMPSGAQGQMPDMGSMPSGMQGQMPDMGSMPSGAQDANAQAGASTSSSAQASQQQSTKIYRLTGEKMTALIPVGSPVTTLLGATTTFARLRSGDYIKAVVEKDETGNDFIAAIYIVG